MDIKQKNSILLYRYENTRKKGKKKLKTTLLFTTDRQMQHIKILLAKLGIKVEAKPFGNHQLITMYK